MSKDNIVFIGMPGAGKSTLGVVLAKACGMDFLDCDLLIQGIEGRTLQRIIDLEGVDGFLAVENRILLGIDRANTVVSTGGSAVYSDEAMRHLAEIGTVVYLKVSLDQLRERLGDLHERGVVMREGIGDNLELLYQERAPLYERYADLTVEVGDRAIPDAVALLRERLGL